VKVGDLVRSNSSHREPEHLYLGIVIKEFADHELDPDGLHVLWENGNIHWVYEDDVEVISEDR
jgi:hypothetical protein